MKSKNYRSFYAKGTTAVGADWVITSVEPCGDYGLERCATVRVDQRVLWPCAKSTAALVDQRKAIRPDLI